MADNSVYPGSIDDFGTVENNIDYVEAKHINQLNDAIGKIETELGTNPSGTYSDVKTRLDQIALVNLADCQVSLPENSQTLIYNNASGKWENKIINADIITDGTTNVMITGIQEVHFETAYTHSQTSGNPHNTTAAEVGAISAENNSVRENQIDWGTGSNQVNLDSIPDGALVKIGQNCSTSGTPQFAKLGLKRAPGANTLLHIQPETDSIPFRIEDASQGTWWNQAWSYKKVFTISNATGTTLTNFQTVVNLDTSALISAGKIKNDCSDLRVLNTSEDTLLDFWVDTFTINTASTAVWIKFPSLSPGNTTVYLYYGNSSATSASNGDNTFIFFDDFSNGSYTDKWQVITGTWTESSGALSVSSYNTPANIKLINDITLTDYVLDLRARKTGGNEAFLVTFRVGSMLPWWNLGGSGDTRSDVEGIDGTTVIPQNFATGTWYDIRVKVNKSNDRYIGYVGANTPVQQWDVTDTSVGQSGNQNSDKMALGTWNTQVDYSAYRVRQFVATEPTYTAGAEYSKDALKIQIDREGIITEAQWQGEPIGTAFGGTGLTAKAIGPDIQGLAVILNSTNPAYQADINATSLQVGDYNLSNIDITVDITQSGANGLDSGSESAGTWYSLWMIYNPVSVTTAGLLSVSASSPVLPSGYTEKRLVGWVRNNASSDFVNPPVNIADISHWRGDPSSADKTESDLSTTNAWTDLDLSAIIPPGAKTVNMICSLTGNAGSLLKFRRNGQTGDKSVAVIGSSVNSVTVYADLIVSCDDDRIIEYYRSSDITAITLTVKTWWA